MIIIPINNHTVAQRKGKDKDFQARYGSAHEEAEARGSFEFETFQECIASSRPSRAAF